MGQPPPCSCTVRQAAAAEEKREELMEPQVVRCKPEDEIVPGPSLHWAPEAPRASVRVSLRSSRSSARSSRSSASEVDLKDMEYFPMHTVAMPIFMGLTAMTAFEVLEERRDVHVAEGEAVIHFISHEWLGTHHPDPEGVQLRRMQHVFGEVMQGRAADLFTPADWAAFSQRVSTGSQGAYRQLEGAANRGMAGGPLTLERFREHTTLGEVWLDFGSIPQVGSDEDRRKFDAIRSIPAYLERSTYFWVLAPPARHADTGVLCSFSTWRSRGWCRLEEWGNFLKSQPCAPLIVTHSKKLTTLGFVDFMVACQGKPHMAPCAGAFTCCRQGHQEVLPSGVKHQVPCDKTFAAPVLLKFFRAKRAQLRASPAGIFWHAMFVGKVEPMLFGGMPRELLPKEIDMEEESLEAFLHRFGFGSAGERPAPGFSAWCCAAMTGHVPMLRRLQNEPEAVALLGDAVHDMNLAQSSVQQGHIEALEFLLDHGLVPTESLNARSPGLGLTTLDRAGRGGCPAMVRHLLQRRADLQAARRTDGATPLHSAAASGHASCCEVLLQQRADVGALDCAGRAALHLAADLVTLYGDSQGKLPTLQVLLACRADPLLADGEGRSALAIARDAGFEEGETVLSRAIISGG